MKKNNRIYIYVILTILVLLCLTEALPILITIMFPDVCYGCTKIGKLQQELNSKYNLGFIASFSYIVLFVYFIYLSSQFKNMALKIVSIAFCLFMIYFPTLPIVNMITIFLGLIQQNPPFISNYENIFPASKQIEQNSNTIISEFVNYTENNQPECIRKTNPGFKIEKNSDGDNCWRALYLKKIGKIDNNMVNNFPSTMELVKDDQIHNAFFSILDPGVEIPPHIGYYKGYLRYHMGVVIPNNETDKTDDKAYIVCGGQKYIWKENVGVVFDDMYLHYVKNPTNQIRVVLYLDIKRKYESAFVNQINDFGLYLMENSIVMNNFLKNQHSQRKIADF